MPKQETAPIGEHAVVIGASMAGLLAARALSTSFERVTILERDQLPAPGKGRKAVPQGSHAHVMLASGQRAIEELLPGITDELLAAGAQSCKSMREIRLVIAGHQMTREAQGADVLLASRPLIEGQGPPSRSRPPQPLSARALRCGRPPHILGPQARHRPAGQRPTP